MPSPMDLVAPYLCLGLRGQCQDAIGSHSTSYDGWRIRELGRNVGGSLSCSDMCVFAMKRDIHTVAFSLSQGWCVGGERLGVC